MYRLESSRCHSRPRWKISDMLDATFDFANLSKITPNIVSVS